MSLQMVIFWMACAAFVGMVFGMWFMDWCVRPRIKSLTQTNSRRWRYLSFMQDVHGHAWHKLSDEQRKELRADRERLALDYFGTTEEEAYPRGVQ
jgi:p-aminobenzoyl-glutamate transporter AbgT